MKKTIAFIMLATLSTGALAWRNSGWGNDDFDGVYGNTNINSIQMGDYSFDNGQIGGDSYNATTIRMDNFSFTNGQIGERSFNCSTIRLGGGFTSTTCN